MKFPALLLQKMGYKAHREESQVESLQLILKVTSTVEFTVALSVIRKK